MHNDDTANPSGSSGLAGVIQRNIQALLHRRQEEAQTKSYQYRFADAITHFTGSMLFVYIHLVLFATWIIVNLPAVPLPKFDPLT